MSFNPPILTPEEEAEVAAKAAQNVARLAAPDNTPLLALAANLRARHVDPKDIEFAGRPDRVAASELQLKALLLRAGVTEVVMTPQLLAEQQHAAAWTQTELNPAVAALVAERVAGIEKLPAREQVERAMALRAELGADDYD